MIKKEEDKAIKNTVKGRYGQIARGESDICCNPNVVCCGDNIITPDQISRDLGYSRGEMNNSPAGSNLGLGCGNPVAIAELREGETVLDLGSGGGFDCFLAARQVGPEGKVIGVDMTSAMLERAQKNAVDGGFKNVEFRFGEIERLPITDNSVDVIMSNCVINLAPDKKRVFVEAFRVLKPGGRLCIFDVVATAPLPDDLRSDLDAYVGCIAGATLVDDMVAIMEAAGYIEVRVEPQCQSREQIKNWMPEKHVENYVVSALIRAVKP